MKLAGDRLSAHVSGDFAADDDLLSRNHSRHLSSLADDDLGRLNVTFDLVVDLQDALADNLQPLANDLEVVSNDRLLSG